jgi:hypothetical protein
MNKANAIALDTYERLKKAASILPGTSLPINYRGFIANQVSAFNAARTTAEKQLHIRVIIWYVTWVREQQIGQ